MLPTYASHGPECAVVEDSVFEQTEDLFTSAVHRLETKIPHADFPGASVRFNGRGDINQWLQALSFSYGAEHFESDTFIIAVGTGNGLVIPGFHPTETIGTQVCYSPLVRGKKGPM